MFVTHRNPDLAASSSRDPVLQMPVRDLYAKVKQLQADGADVRIQPIGFLQILLPTEIVGTNQQPYEGYRLHIWYPQRVLARDRREPIHDHVTDITSRVICGEVENFTYRVDERPEGTYEIFHEHAGSGGTLVDAQRTADLRVVAREMIPAGKMYFIPRGVPHAGYACDDVTMTIIKRDNASDDPRSRVFVSKSEQGEFGRYWRSSLSQKEAWQLVEFAFSNVLSKESPQSA